MTRNVTTDPQGTRAGGMPGRTSWGEKRSVAFMSLCSRGDSGVTSAVRGRFTPRRAGDPRGSSSAEAVHRGGGDRRLDLVNETGGGLVAAAEAIVRGRHVQGAARHAAEGTRRRIRHLEVDRVGVTSVRVVAAHGR